MCLRSTAGKSKTKKSILRHFQSSLIHFLLMKLMLQSTIHSKFKQQKNQKKHTKKKKLEKISPPFKIKQNPNPYYQKHRYYLLSIGLIQFPHICPIKWDKYFASLFLGKQLSPT